MYPSRILRASRPEKPNITGFDIKKLVAATGQPKYDPWERAEAWRYTGTFSRWNRFKNSLPGLGIATVAFAAYCTYEHFFLKNDHHDEKGHGEAHH
ncbi:NADH-ubiquinone oxidoreductase B12 subunit family-domain-containing protein [Podospora appendiculata]|uniref:NADH-ubiquinone oxidoreductase B12 subunit family-domain-containing protein n=1 Tax=Podospora appendiculata TaxID=314037 RepID=A0AAE0XGK6_9PEZI|nr:NADH-ubiquinone oxidoreductase B12 subunit family-domain-containing protein [Podospora appendiculata]